MVKIILKPAPAHEGQGISNVEMHLNYYDWINGESEEERYDKFLKSLFEVRRGKKFFSEISQESSADRENLKGRMVLISNGRDLSKDSDGVLKKEYNQEDVIEIIAFDKEKQLQRPQALSSIPDTLTDFTASITGPTAPRASHRAIAAGGSGRPIAEPENVAITTGADSLDSLLQSTSSHSRPQRTIQSQGNVSSAAVASGAGAAISAPVTIGTTDEERLKSIFDSVKNGELSVSFEASDGNQVNISKRRIGIGIDFPLVYTTVSGKGVFDFDSFKTSILDEMNINLKEFCDAVDSGNRESSSKGTKITCKDKIRTSNYSSESSDLNDQELNALLLNLRARLDEVPKIEVPEIDCKSSNPMYKKSFILNEEGEVALCYKGTIEVPQKPIPVRNTADLRQILLQDKEERSLVNIKASYKVLEKILRGDLAKAPEAVTPTSLDEEEIRSASTTSDSLDTLVANGAGVSLRRPGVISRLAGRIGIGSRQ